MADGKLEVVKVKGEENPAYLMTKILTLREMEDRLGWMGFDTERIGEEDGIRVAPEDALGGRKRGEEHSELEEAEPVIRHASGHRHVSAGCGDARAIRRIRKAGADADHALSER